MRADSPIVKTSLYLFVMSRLEATELTYREIARGSGVPARTVEKIARREIKDPGVSHVEKLAHYFRMLEERVA